MSPETYAITSRHGGVGTIGSCTTKPGIVTSVVEDCRITLDQRNLDAAALAGAYGDARAASERFAKECGVGVRWERIWNIEPVLFDPRLLQFCEEAIVETCGKAHRLPSGPLHDAAEVARTGVPTVMVFSSSINGISHAKEEDTPIEHLELALQAYGLAAERVIAGAR